MAEAAISKAPDRPGEAPRWQAIAVLLFGACVIGLSPILVRLTTTGPAAAGLWRLSVALPLLALMTRRANGPIHRPSPIALVRAISESDDRSIKLGIVRKKKAQTILLKW